MKIRPEGFVYDYKPSNYITYDGGGRVGTWVTIAANGSVQRSLGTGDDYASNIASARCFGKCWYNAAIRRH